MARATAEERIHLWQFLGRCEQAAEPPPVSSTSALSTLLGRGFLADFPKRFGDLRLSGVPKTVSFPEELPDDRPGRIAMLARWLKRFPAYKRLAAEQAVMDAQESFERARKHKKHRGNPRLGDDLVHFRFWHWIALAEVMRDVQAKPPPDADERASAVKAAKRLLQLAKKTSLLSDLGDLGHLNDRDIFERGLRKVEALAAVELSARFDDHSSHRNYLGHLTRAFKVEFDVVLPTPIAHLSALRGEGTDLTHDVKLVSKYAKEFGNPAK
jgi:hypothetical protein